MPLWFWNVLDGIFSAAAVLAADGPLRAVSEKKAEIKLQFIPAERRESIAQGSGFQERFCIDFTDRCQPALSDFIYLLTFSFGLISYTFFLYFSLALSLCFY